MSNHHSRRAIDLHHKQVNEGKERRHSRLLGRLESFREARSLIHAEVRRDYLFAVAFSFACFIFIALASAVYLGYIFDA